MGRKRNTSEKLKIVSVQSNVTFFSLLISLADLFGVSEETFLRLTEKLMNTLITHIKDFIYWPKRSHYGYIARKFNEMGK